MALVAMAVLVLFDIIVCAVEIPKMLKQKLFKELGVFSVLLLLGTTVSVMKIFNAKIPNPSEFYTWVFSPLSDLMKSVLKAN